MSQQYYKLRVCPLCFQRFKNHDDFIEHQDWHAQQEKANERKNRQSGKRNKHKKTEKG